MLWFEQTGIGDETGERQTGKTKNQELAFAKKKPVEDCRHFCHRLDYDPVFGSGGSIAAGRRRFRLQDEISAGHGFAGRWRRLQRRSGCFEQCSRKLPRGKIQGRYGYRWYRLSEKKLQNLGRLRFRNQNNRIEIFL